MPEPADLCRTVRPLPVADGKLGDLQIQLCRSEEQVEVPEGIEVSEERPVRLYSLVVTAPEHFGSAQRVRDTGFQGPREQQPERLVAKEIEETHRLVLHRVHQAGAVDEVPLPLNKS